MSSLLRVAWLTTGRGPGSYGALEYTLRAIAAGLPIELAVVFVNRAPGESEATDRLLSLVRGAGVPLETLSSVGFRKERGGKLSRPGEPLPAWRSEFDAQVAALLGRHDFSIGVMFGYMLIATEALYGRFPFLNDHPALPDGPTGTYEEVILELIRTGARESGCMMNVVTGDLDRGPVLSFCGYGIRDAANEDLWKCYDPSEGAESRLFADVRARGVAREGPFVVETLRALADGQLSSPPGGVPPLNLTEAVERSLA